MCFAQRVSHVSKSAGPHHNVLQCALSIQGEIAYWGLACLTGVLALQDPYANYVLQSALSVSSGQLHIALVDAMRSYLPSLRGTPHGKRILSKINVKI